ncbi:MAG: hypothetical protein SV775_10350 [Thermodesulfobacteriota bacterium]|nr:hypothetical protein [Thermodesulfobacteriota bacterium]
MQQVVEKVRNLPEACRRHSVSQSQFYEDRSPFQEKAFEGLIDQPPIPNTFADETPHEVREKVIELTIEYPACGPVRSWIRPPLDSYSQLSRVKGRSDPCQKPYASVEDFQKDFDQWRHYYKYQQPHRGYLNI